MGAKTEREVIMPEGVQVSLENDKLTVKGEKGELVREFKHPKIDVNVEKGKITIKTLVKTSKIRALLGTWQAHMQNMIKGVTEGFKYKLKMVFAHFPMDIQAKEGYIEINNFIGEKAPRMAKIMGATTVNIQKDVIELEGINKEEVGQTAGNLERATRVKKRDTRVFQDGVYITEKP